MISDAVRSLGWLRASSLYQYSVLTRFRRVITSGEPFSLAENVAVQEYKYDTRHVNRSRSVSLKKEVGKRMFGFSAPSMHTMICLGTCAQLLLSAVSGKP